MPNMMFLTATTGEIIDTALAGIQLNGVLDEVINLLPTVLPIAIGFLAIRKGLSFLMGVLRSA